MRTHYCGQLNASLDGQIVTLCGWATVVATTAASSSSTCATAKAWPRWSATRIVPTAFKIAESVRNEFCLKITGKVRPRPAGTTNANLASGEIEILCHESRS